MTKTFRSTRDFAEISDLIALETAEPSDAFSNAFTSNLDGFRVSEGADGMLCNMPDAMQVQLATEMLIRTLFDVLRATRMERYAERIAWGVVNSLHLTARTVAHQADAAAQGVKDLIRGADGSEVAMNELEDAQKFCFELDEASDALACMRDYAAATFRAETGKPWSTTRGSLVSSKRTASVIAATDFLAGRRIRKAEQYNPQGPIVAFSSGRVWEDHRPIYAELDRMVARMPNMVLMTTAQNAGGDAIAEAWAAKAGVRLVKLDLPQGMGKRAAFVRNERMASLKPVDAIVCEGSGIQAHLVRVLREAGVQPRLLTSNGGPANWAR